MAAGLGFKTFNTGDVLTAADVNGYLMQGVLVFASAAARDAAITSPQEGQIAYLKDTNGTTYYTGSAWAALVPTSFGKVLQVVQATSSTSTSVTSTTFTDTSLTASITPSASTSKILVLVSQNTQIYRSAGNAFGKIRIMRDATSVFDMTASNDRAFGWENTFNAYNEHWWTIAMNYLDSPSTTSATTYKTQGAVNASGPTVTFQNSSAKSTITLIEIGA